MLLTPGRILADRYKVEEYVGEGGMQEVYRACDSHFNRTVALKVPKNASAERRFVQSARVSARIVHTNVAKTLDYFDEGQRGHLVEEFVLGRDLGRVMRTTMSSWTAIWPPTFFTYWRRGLPPPITLA
jgi:serine/threonine protein kinase